MLSRSGSPVDTGEPSCGATDADEGGLADPSDVGFPVSLRRLLIIRIR